MDKITLTSTSMVILAFIILAILVVGYAIFSKMSKKVSKQKFNKFGEKNSLGVCPICRTILDKDEQVKTATYPGKEDDRLCYIYGCPHCYPTNKDDAFRTCPVCKKELNDGSYLIARHFIRKDNTERIHILGCPHCRFGKNNS